MQSLEDGAKEMFAKEKSSTSYVLLVAPCFKHWKKKKKKNNTVEMQSCYQKK